MTTIDEPLHFLKKGVLYRLASKWSSTNTGVGPMNARTKIGAIGYFAEASFQIGALLGSDARYYVREGELQGLLPTHSWGAGFKGIVVRNLDYIPLLIAWEGPDGSMGANYRNRELWSMKPGDTGSVPINYVKGYALDLLRK